jgi:ethanolamine utilization protein EutN
MILCRVVGDVVAPVKNPHLEGAKLLLCQPVGLDLAPKGNASLIALDRVQAGEGDLVLVNKEGGGARIVYQDDATPAQSVIVAIVDDFHIDRRELAIDPPVRKLSS